MADPEQVADSGPVTIEGTGIDLDSTVEDIASSLMPEEEGGDPEQTAAAAGEEARDVKAAPAAPAEPEKVAGTDATVPTSTVDTPPDTWRAEAKAAWTALPPVVKEEMRKREADISNYVARVKGPAEIGAKLEQVLQPHLEMFQKTNTDPWANIDAMFTVQKILLYGAPAQKTAILTSLAQQAGIQLEGGQLSQPADAMHQYVAQLEQRINQMQSGVKSVTDTVQEARLAELQDNVRKFAEDTEAHPHFSDVADEISRLIRAGAARNLSHAYDMACASDPIVRQKMVDAAVAKAADVRAKAEKERVAKARETAKPRVRTTRTVATPQPLGDIDSTLKDTLADIHSRA